MDIDILGINGIEGVVLIRKFFPDIHILMQTVFDDDDRILQHSKRVQVDIFLKMRDQQNCLMPFWKCIMAVLLNVAKRLPKGVESVSSGKPDSEEDFNLSARERGFRAVSQGKSYKMIADELCISYDTVRAYEENL
ncbi:MAG: response regulator transcription factor [Bacteroidetes bacterium]|nr:response regulator transcription factor [Bacteroidota bacterium]